MGQLVEGHWQTGWYEPDKKGAFQRPATKFRNKAPAIEAGRYHLYVSYACPWAHRTLITRALRGLEHAIGFTAVDPKMGDDGWVFRDDTPDPLHGARRLQDVYRRAEPRYTGRVTVPVLWDRERDKIVNNESRDVMRMLDVDFAAIAKDPHEPILYPEELRTQIDETLDAIYPVINNGVYRCGFATSQGAYDEAVRQLFDALAHWDRVLARQRYLCGDRMTEADVAMFTTLLRFDLVYYSHFKANLRRLQDHRNLWRFTRRMYQHPAIRPTCKLDEIKVHYYWSQTTLNPSRIVPVGPDLEAALAAPVDD